MTAAGRVRANPSGFRRAFVAIVVLVVVSDQLVDTLVRSLPGPLGFVDGVLMIKPSMNDGIAFGLLQGTGPLPIVLAAGGVAVITFLGLRRATRLPAHVALALVVGGGTANLLERLMAGAVLDYVDIGFGELRWPTFNTSDMAISLAILLILAEQFRPRDATRD